VRTLSRSADWVWSPTRGGSLSRTLWRARGQPGGLAGDLAPGGAQATPGVFRSTPIRTPEGCEDNLDSSSRRTEGDTSVRFHVL
jgi:hypothetical protein